MASVEGIVGDGLRSLRGRLPDILQAGIDKEAGGLPWTTVLHEVDRRKGRDRRESDAYAATDIQVQLRMLTERLAGLGYPYDDGDRMVSILAGELRTVRNLWAHTHEFTAVEAFRALDSMSRLLDALGDEAGSAEIEKMRNSVIPDLLEEVGIGDHKAEPAQAPTTAEPEDQDETGSDEQSAARVRRAAARSVDIRFSGTGENEIKSLGVERIPFDPWVPVHSGPSETLDNFRVKGNTELVRSVGEEIIEAEGPIREGRLAFLVLRSFGRQRLSRNLRASIIRQMSKLPAHKDGEGFYWPSDVDPDTWAEFRPTPDEVQRDFDDISLVELRNAAREIQAVTTEELSAEELKRAVLAVFGFQKLMPRYQARMRMAVLGL